MIKLIFCNISSDIYICQGLQTIKSKHSYHLTIGVARYSISNYHLTKN